MSEKESERSMKIGLDLGAGAKTVWRIGFKYEHMEKFRLLPDEYATKEEAERAAKALISSEPFDTTVVERKSKKGNSDGPKK